MSTVQTSAKISKVVSIPSAKRAPQTHVSRGAQIVPGVDRLELSLCLKCENLKIFSQLERAKAHVQNTLSPCLPFSIQFEEFQWNLSRMGIKYYPYALSSGDISLFLSNREVDSSYPNARVIIGSVSCQSGVFKVFDRLSKWLEFVGLKIVKTIVGRADLSADLIGKKLNTLSVGSASRWVSRARTFNVYYKGWKITGVQIGKGDFVARIYDKSEELKKSVSKRLFFYDLWNVPPGTPVTRVEFQLRRGALKDMEVDSIEDFQNRMDSLWQYCTHNWLRQAHTSLSETRRSNNQHLIKPSKFWLQVQSAVFQRVSPCAYRAKKNLHKNVDDMIAQARGCLLNVVVAAGHKSDDFFGIMATVRDVVQNDFALYMSDKIYEFKQKFDLRHNEIFCSV